MASHYSPACMKDGCTWTDGPAIYCATTDGIPGLYYVKSPEYKRSVFYRDPWAIILTDCTKVDEAIENPSKDQQWYALIKVGSYLVFHWSFWFKRLILFVKFFPPACWSPSHRQFVRFSSRHSFHCLFFILWKTRASSCFMFWCELITVLLLSIATTVLYFFRVPCVTGNVAVC